MALDPSSLLSQVESAIEYLLTNKAASYSIGARTVSYQDLGKLFDERRMLLSEVQRASGGGAFRLAKFQRTSR